MVTTEERIEGHYEVQEVPYGKAYRWGPDCAIIECDCGQSMLVQEVATVCPRCGARYTGVIGTLAGEPLKRKAAHYLIGHREYEFSGLFSGLKAQDEVNRLLDELYC